MCLRETQDYCAQRKLVTKPTDTTGIFTGSRKNQSGFFYRIFSVLQKSCLNWHGKNYNPEYALNDEDALSCFAGRQQTHAIDLKLF
uniref:Uncharacterized protein n=1 Tax=Candidatus Nitrotoga fabula TaxID=2182327 RepID=A0A2X0SKY1_9PROT|nr:protein of unknown function [Candidatus Nitrotoga fabula]